MWGRYGGIGFQSSKTSVYYTRHKLESVHQVPAELNSTVVERWKGLGALFGHRFYAERFRPTSAWLIYRSDICTQKRSFAEIPASPQAQTKPIVRSTCRRSPSTWTRATALVPDESLGFSLLARQ